MNKEPTVYYQAKDHAADVWTGKVYGVGMPLGLFSLFPKTKAKAATSGINLQNTPLVRLRLTNRVGKFKIKNNFNQSAA